MVFAAGQVLTAAQLNNITTVYLEARSSGDEAVGFGVADVNGATLTFTTPLANTKVKVDSTWDLTHDGAATLVVGFLMTDGVTDTTGEAHGSATGRLTLKQSWTVTLASAGSHTLKLRRNKTAAAGAQTLHGTHTKIQVSGPGLT